LFFAGEWLDIDGVTGGFNFQAAWTTGFVIGHAMTEWGGWLLIWGEYFSNLFLRFTGIFMP